ncbi:hypothetical protein Tco_0933185 [Tanacetum coccineum]
MTKAMRMMRTRGGGGGAALARPILLLLYLLMQLVFPLRGKEPFIPPTPPLTLYGARITVWPQDFIIHSTRGRIGESSTARPTRGRGIDYGFVSMVDAEERRQGIRDVGYGIRDTWVDPAEAVLEIAPMTVGKEEVNTRVTELAELHEHDTQDLYALLEDAQDSRSRISQRVDMDSHRSNFSYGGLG